MVCGCSLCRPLSSWLIQLPSVLARQHAWVPQSSLTASGVCVRSPSQCVLAEPLLSVVSALPCLSMLFTGSQDTCHIGSLEPRSVFLCVGVIA